MGGASTNPIADGAAKGRTKWGMFRRVEHPGRAGTKPAIVGRRSLVVGTTGFPARRLLHAKVKREGFALPRDCATLFPVE